VSQYFYCFLEDITRMLKIELSRFRIAKIQLDEASSE
jgi:hypothetical protein